MPLVNMKDMLEHAYAQGYAVGAFGLANLDFLQGILDAAERCRAPVILSLDEPSFGELAFPLLMPAAEAAARRASVPVALQLNRGASLDSAIKAINLGCNGVMVDASRPAPGGSTSQTREVVAMAHACGVPVGAGLGEGAGDSAERAGAFVAETGVDFLALPAAGLRGGEDYRSLGIPLAIDADAGLDEQELHHLIATGVAKIDAWTAMSEAAAAVIRDNANNGDADGFSAMTRGARQAIGREAERCMHLWGSAGRAAEVLGRCAPWLPVEHLIIYNVDGLEPDGVDAMMAEGRRTLGAIPGVREVITGEAVQDQAAYRYTWLVRFCHPAVIDSYREHPDHVAFADNHFRPVAGRRISIDYLTNGTATADAGAADGA